ncbi:hypothetical protein BDZ97DRAFT_1767577 [Flammula alnicola]|nr:hypothetical protein BDZ97DRAFT_1767577 [Flammula alnicola]
MSATSCHGVHRGVHHGVHCGFKKNATQASPKTLQFYKNQPYAFHILMYARELFGAATLLMGLFFYHGTSGHRKDFQTHARNSVAHAVLTIDSMETDKIEINKDVLTLIYSMTMKGKRVNLKLSNRKSCIFWMKCQAFLLLMVQQTKMPTFVLMSRRKVFIATRSSKLMIPRKTAKDLYGRQILEKMQQVWWEYALKTNDIEAAADQTKPHSPEHKQQHISNSQDDKDVSQLDLPPLSFEEFDGLFIVACKKPNWNKLLQSNPNFWSKKCISWVHSLQIAFNHCMEITVQPSIFHYKAWKTAVKASNLHRIINFWSDPSGLVIWKSDFMQILI